METHEDRIRKAKDRVEREADELVVAAHNSGGVAALTQLIRVQHAVGDLANAEALARSAQPPKPVSPNPEESKP